MVALARCAKLAKPADMLTCEGQARHLHAVSDVHAVRPLGHAISGVLLQEHLIDPCQRMTGIRLVSPSVIEDRSSRTALSG